MMGLLILLPCSLPCLSGMHRGLGAQLLSDFLSILSCFPEIPTSSYNLLPYSFFHYFFSHFSLQGFLSLLFSCVHLQLFLLHAMQPCKTYLMNNLGIIPV